jgi:hypothetical protein
MQRKLWIAAGPILAASFWFLTMAPRELLPSPIAIHWSLTGQPDGFAPVEVAAAINGGVGFLFGVIFSFINSPKVPRFARGALNLTVGGLLVLIAGVLLSAIYSQVGMESAVEAGFPIGLLALTLGVAPALIWLFLSWPTLEVVGENLLIRLRGIRILRLHLSEISRATQVEVSAADFGGWGMRVNGRGEVAFIPKSGPALRLETYAGEVIIVRVRDPQIEREKLGVN